MSTTSLRRLPRPRPLRPTPSRRRAASRSARETPPRWGFAADWNATLARHPQTVLAAFLSAQSTTWLGLYAALSSGGAALPPSLAAGWAIGKFTKKFRQPVNAALAAMAVRACPSLGEVKVTPLVTGFVMGDKDKRTISKQIDETVPAAKPVIDAVSRGAKWLEGPIDKYGLSYYLASRASGLATIGISSYLVHRGVDVGTHLSDWGVGPALGEAAGTAAAAAVCNVGCVPLHFYAAVYGVRGLERATRAAAEGAVDGKREAERDFRRDHDGGREGGGGNGGSEEGESRESEYERISDGAMRSASLLLLMYSVMASMYSFRLVGEKALGADSSSNDTAEGHIQVEGKADQ